MAGSTYPTLSSTLYTYVALLDHLNKLRASPIAQCNAKLHDGLDVCEEKLRKYLDASTDESECYYFATSKHCIPHINSCTHSRQSLQFWIHSTKTSFSKD